MKPMTPPTHYAKYDQAAAHLQFQQDRLEKRRALVFKDDTVMHNGMLRAFHNLPEIHYLVAVYAIAVGDLELARTHLHYSVLYKEHIFAMAGLPPGETVAFQPPDHPTMVGSGTTGPVGYTTHQSWLDAFALAVFLDYGPVVDRLLLFRSFSLGTGQTEANPVYEPWAALYRATIEQPANLEELLRSAFDGAGPQNQEPDFFSELAHTVIPNFKVYGAVGAIDQPAFTSAVDEANDAHLKWYSMGNKTGDAPALLNLHTAAMVKLGQLRGLNAPASPYIPELGPLDPTVGIPNQ